MRDVEDAKKARALELLEEGISYRDIAEEVKGGKSTVQRWAKARGVPAWCGEEQRTCWDFVLV